MDAYVSISGPLLFFRFEDKNPLIALPSLRSRTNRNSGESEMTIRDSLDPDRSLWDLIAVELRRQRELHKISGSRLGDLLGCDRSTVSRYESGLLKFPERCAKITDREWHTEMLFTRLVRFAKTGKDENWFLGYTEFEAIASRVRDWELAWVPGLLQTPEYARAALTVGLVDDLEQALEKRLARQRAVFERPTPPQLSMILNWLVLELPVGGAEVMRGQLARLIEAADQPNISVRVLGKDAGHHLGLDGPFALLTVDDRDMAYDKASGGGRLLQRPADVQRFQLRYDRIGDLAAPVGPSRALLEQAMENFR
jgi:transcriptional regulator with XRE-family HTH domain